MKATWSLLAAFQTMSVLAQAPSNRESAPVFIITFETAKSATPLDGRLLLLLSTDPAEEPRHQINDGPKTQIVFGLDVESWKPGEARIVEATNADVFGYPIRSLRDLKPAEYTVQAFLDRYETFHRADGNVLKLP